MSEYFEQTNPDTPLGGRYKVIRNLGAGGFGQTFLAEDLHLPGNPQCVVKKLKPQTIDPDALVMARRLFDTEAQALYQLGDHDQIPRLLAHFEDDQEFYLAQEFIEGEPLTQELVSGQPWPEVRVIALLQDILQVLAFVHQQQVIHRDLKPPNLIRRRCDGKVVVIDFGAVKQASTQTVNPETGKTNLTISIGTKGYMPNEQLAGIPRFSSDVYAVGMLGIQALTGVHPTRFKEDIETGEINWREHAPTISPELADILDQMVRYDFRDRYPTAVEALEALQSLPAITDSLLPKQPLPEVTRPIPNQELPSPDLAIEPTESESELESTNIWVPTEPPIPTNPKVSSTDTTAPLSQQESPQEQGKRVPTSATTGLFQRQLIKFWPVLAVLAAVGATFAITKTVLSPSTPSPTISPVPTTSPTATPVPKPTPRKPEAKELLSQADRLREKGEYQEALSLYDQTIKLNSKMAKAYWGRCYSLNKLRKPAEAIVACNDAIDLDPRYAEALWSKGNALEQQKLDLEALQLYEQATETKPNFAEAWVSLGVTLQKFGRSVEAIDALDKAIDLKRDSAEAWSTRGIALWNLGRFDEAIPSLDKALQLQPDNPEAQKLRELARKQLGR
ncbi:MAG TPA: tetratricopeptide repeat protein [Coleofasciculaceae cyanobacterium]|jgi:serine/threonine protein kinase